MRSASILALAACAALPGLALAAPVAERESINPGLGKPPPDVERASPAATWRSFFTLSERESFDLAAQLLDLGDVPTDQQKAVGTTVARQLHDVLKLLEAKPDEVTGTEPEGPKSGGEPTNTAVAHRFKRGNISGEVWLRRTKDKSTGELAWLFTRQTVSSVPFWYRVVVEGKLPESSTPLNAGLGAPPSDLDRSNPRAAVLSFMKAAKAGDFARAAHVLDVGARPEGEQKDLAPLLARRFRIVLDRTFVLNAQTISNDPAGAPEANLPQDKERITKLELRGQPLDLLLADHIAADGSHVWTFDRATVEWIDPLYDQYGLGWIGDHIPVVLLSHEVANLYLWQWAGLLLLIAAAWLVGRVLASRVLEGGRRLATRTKVGWDDSLIHALDGPLAVAIAALFLVITIRWLGLSEQAQRTASVMWKLMGAFGLGWVLSRGIDIASKMLRAAATRDSNKVALNFIPVLSRLIQVTVWVLSALFMLDTVGVNAMGLLAGLSIGGVAIAFAAQKTIENLFGTLAIATDRPFQIGDFIAIGSIQGTVEDVGLRSTRVRTGARTLVTIPNGTLISERVENFSVRDRFIFNPTIGLLYGSSKAQLELVIDGIKRLLLSHPKIYKDTVRVRLSGFGDSAINIGVFTWIDVKDFGESTAVAEELYFRILEIIEEAGTGFAYPSRTIYTAQQPPMDGSRATEAERRVAQLRADGKLMIPEPPKPS